jgi:malonyl-ACP decarboxylase
MKNVTPEVVLSGVGVTSAVGQGKAAFAAALMRGDHAFRVMQRPGRQHRGTAFLGAELPELAWPSAIPKRLLRTATLSGQTALLTLHEAWGDAQLDAVDPLRIGLIVGGCNFQQREQVLVHDEYANRLEHLRPSYALSFLDSDLCGLCTEQFAIQGFAYTLGAASASGQLAVLQAVEVVASGRVDVCIALGALMDLSYWECQSLRTAGAMGSDRYASEPALACRPFDRARDGFIFGECCAVVVVERMDHAEARGAHPYAQAQGWATAVDRNRNPDPSLQGEIRAITTALTAANLSPRDIDYINPHGTGSIIGDELEAQAIRSCELSHAFINTTKSITGHGLSAAGTVEIVATLLQMRESRLHPSRNLEQPIDPALNWVGATARAHDIRHALALSFGFGGINSALCLRRWEG